MAADPAELAGLFWVVLVALASIVAAIAALVRSEHTVPPFGGSSRAPRGRRRAEGRGASRE